MRPLQYEISATPLAAPSPIEGFHATVDAFPANIALEIGDANWRYDELADIAGGIASAILADGGDAELVAVFASRSLTAYAGTLAIFSADKAHVAINPSHPVERNGAILALAGAETIIIDNDALPLLDALLLLDNAPKCVIAPETADLDGLRAAHPDCRFVDAGEIAELSGPLPCPGCIPDDLAFLVFTSGSTGAPKGIAINHGNLAVYMQNFRNLAAPISSDRVAQTFELTFDVALHDMFNAWWSGATLCVVPTRALIAPARFIRDKAITYWFSVASCAMLMQRQGTLKPGVLSGLRVSMLCGEALPAASASAWADAAPNSVLYNVYGPTETTMEVAFYRWSRKTSPAECRRGVVPIGIPFDDHDHVLLDNDGCEINAAGRGEMYLSGPQVGPGYWQDREKSAAAFVTLPGREGLWYRTGDLIERDGNGLYHFVGRTDHQIKLHGNRIELGEVEAALRQVSGTDMVAVIAHPIIGGNAQGLIGFVATTKEMEGPALRRDLTRLIPIAMVPDRIELMADFPLNSNRKIDRQALIQSLER